MVSADEEREPDAAAKLLMKLRNELEKANVSEDAASEAKKAAAKRATRGLVREFGDDPEFYLQLKVPMLPEP